MVNIQDMVKNAPLLMGVVNVTPDSFSDGGQFFAVDKAVDHALQLLEEGAHILDIGGESTRPGAAAVSVAEEQDRILPVIESIKKHSPQAVISVDTRNANTMQAALKSGTGIINDVSALTHDPESVKVVSQMQCPVILMHMQGNPQTMQASPVYGDVVDEVYNYLDKRVDYCVENGIEKNNIILDVGIGFGKSLEHNLSLLNNLHKFHELKCPLLLGVSRKSFIEKIYPDTPANDRLAGSIAAALKGLEQNIQMFRVHDVKETKQAFDVWRAMKS